MHSPQGNFHLRSQSSPASLDRAAPVKLIGRIRLVYRTIALGSKPPPLTRIAQIGLGIMLLVRCGRHLPLLSIQSVFCLTYHSLADSLLNGIIFHLLVCAVTFHFFN